MLRIFHLRLPTGEPRISRGPWLEELTYPFLYILKYIGNKNYYCYREFLHPDLQLVCFLLDSFLIE